MVGRHVWPSLFYVAINAFSRKGSNGFFDNVSSTSLKNLVNRELTFTALYQSGCSWNIKYTRNTKWWMMVIKVLTKDSFTFIWNWYMAAMQLGNKLEENYIRGRILHGNCTRTVFTNKLLTYLKTCTTRTNGYCKYNTFKALVTPFFVYYTHTEIFIIHPVFFLNSFQNALLLILVKLAV